MLCEECPSFFFELTNYTVDSFDIHTFSTGHR